MDVNEIERTSSKKSTEKGLERFAHIISRTEHIQTDRENQDGQENGLEV